MSEYGERARQMLLRIADERPVDLDPLVWGDEAAGAARRRPDGEAGAEGAPPSARLFPRPAGAAPAICVRLLAAPEDPVPLALRLAEAAVERGVMPVILSAVSPCGLEAFGFRIERIPAGPPEVREAVEREIARFWNAAIVIDGAEVAAFG